MPHLIDHDTGPLADVRTRLQHAHRSAVADARGLARQLIDLQEDRWGTAAKRVGAASGMQPLTELMNQTASVERLLDALDWVESHHSGEVRISINPTTSSHGPDLVVASATPWIFEVSDVARPNDNNRKLRHDLASLCAAAKEYSGGRLFLVVSTEWGSWLSSVPESVWESRGVHQPPGSDFYLDVGQRGTAAIEVRPQT